MLRLHITYELAIATGLAVLMAFFLPASMSITSQCLAAAFLAGWLVHFKIIGPIVQRSAIELFLTGGVLVVAFAVALPVFLSALVSTVVAYFAVGHLR